MSNFNLVILMGRLTKDVELRYSPKGAAVAKIDLAINRKWKSESGDPKEETTFVPVTFFGRTAETVAQYLKKGSSVHISGRLVMDQWDDKQTGQKRSKLGVIADTFHFTDSKKEEDGTAPARQAAPAPVGNADDDGPPKDDCPF